MLIGPTNYTSKKRAKKKTKCKTLKKTGTPKKYSKNRKNTTTKMSKT